jgi:hypothetical protein
MLRKWNRLFDIENLKFYIPEYKIEKIKANILLAEDFVEVRDILSRLINNPIGGELK